MPDDDDFFVPASALGIFNCLRALAQEAASLNLLRTLAAIEDTLPIIARESGIDATREGTRYKPTRLNVH